MININVLQEANSGEVKSYSGSHNQSSHSQPTPYDRMRWQAQPINIRPTHEPQLDPSQTYITIEVLETAVKTTEVADKGK